MTRRAIRAISGDQVLTAQLDWTERSPWAISLELPDGRILKGSGDDLFECLTVIRQAAETDQLRLCVVGARRDAWEP